MRIFEQIFLQTRQKFAGILSYGKNFNAVCNKIAGATVDVSYEHEL